MSKRFTSQTLTPASISQEQREEEGLRQIDQQQGQGVTTPILPTQGLAEATPQSTPTSEYTPTASGVSQTTDPLISNFGASTGPVEEAAEEAPAGITSLVDAIFQGQQERQQKAAAPSIDRVSPLLAAGHEDPRALELPKARGQASPEASDVLGVNVPVAGTVAGENIFETEGERRARYHAEQARQAPMTFNEVFDSVSGLGTDSEQSFNSASSKVATLLNREATSNSRINDTLRNAGIIDTTTNQVSENAARTMLFTMAAEAARVEEAKSDSVSQLQQQLLSGEITEDQLDEKVMYAVTKPDFDRQNLQTTFAGNFAKLYSGAETQFNQADATNPSAGLSLERHGVDRNLRAIDAASFGTNINPQDQSLLAVTTGKILKDLGFVRDVVREEAGKKRAGFDITDDFLDLMIDIAPVLQEFNGKFKKNVTSTPNIGGVPSGQASLVHKLATKTPKGQKTKKGSEVWEALNAMGTAPFGINRKLLGANAIILDSIMSPTWLSPGGGFSRHPLAEHFLLGVNTFMKYFKDEEIHDIDTLNNIYQSVRLRANQGDVEAQNRLADLDNKVKTAKTTQAFVSKSYIRAMLDAAKLNGQTFYHTQTMIAGNSRVMVASTEMNYQSNKKARELTANPRWQVVKPYKPNEANTIGFKMIVARALAHGADRAPSNSKLIQQFNELVADPGITDVATWLHNKLPKYQTEIDDYAKNITDYKTQAELASENPGNVLPGLDINFPKFGKELPNDELMLNKLAALMEVDKGKSDEGGFKLSALIELGSYLTGSTFQTQITAEADGIANGLVIQGMQFGAEDVVKRGGVLYDSDSDVTPDGDMRSFLQQVIVGDTDIGRQAVSSVFAAPAEAEKWIESYANIIGVDSSTIKSLHKLPAMTTPYGMDADYHHSNIRKFLNDNSKINGQLLALPFVNGEKELVDIMAKIEGAALKAGLGGVIQHQAIVKNAYNAAIAAGEVFTVKGPNGWDIVAGGIDYETISDESITFSDGAVARVLTKKPVGSPYTKARSKDEGHITKLGSKGKNQSAVFGTQNIDATIAQRTYTKTKKEMGDDFFGAQVFDAFIGDVSSYGKLVENANSEFKRVNNEYSMVDAEIETIKNIRAKVRKKASDAKKLGLNFDVTENGEYQGMFYLLKRLKNEQAGAEKASGNKTSALQRRLARKKTFGSKIGFRFDGSQMTPEQFVESWEYIVKTLEIESSLRAFSNEVNQKRDELRKKIAESEARGNPVGQYR